MTILRTAVALVAAILVVLPAYAQSGSASKPVSATESNGEATAAKDTVEQESPLVKAAKDGAAKRTKKSRLSIDDKDVKKSAGKLIETTTKPLPPIARPTEFDTRAREEKAAAQAEQQKGSAKGAADRLVAAQKEVESLESELRRIEETYYDEDDPDFREDVIEKRFNDTSARLEKARQDLDAARKAAAGGGVSTP